MSAPRRGHGASHRKVGSPQIEVCDLCGLGVEHASLKESETHSLRGFAICDKHPWEASVRDKPEFQDLRRHSRRRRDAAIRRHPPYGGKIWWRD